MPSPNGEGARGAYFSKVKHPAITYQGDSTTWSLIIYNKNCSASVGGNSTFFLKIYVDGDLWWNEYNDTNYRTWQLKIGKSVTRDYRLSQWETLKPVVHNLKIELYWYSGNESQLQDVTYFPVAVVINAELNNLMVFSYFAIYVLAVFLLGFYILMTGSKMSPAAQNGMVIPEQQTKLGSILPKTSTQLFLPFYVLILVSWQAIAALLYFFSIAQPLSELFYLMIQIAYVILLLFLIGKESSNLRRYGYIWPEETRNYVFCSLLLAISYSLVIIFVPGIYIGYYVFPSPSLALVSSSILQALVISFANETIFRGYIQSKLAKMVSLPIAIGTTSIMFALFNSLIIPFDPSHFFFEVLSLFVLGIMLGTLFHKTRTLLCPVTFYFIILFLEQLIPVKAMTPEYTELFFGAVALAFTLLLLSLLTTRDESDDPESLDMFLPEK